MSDAPQGPGWWLASDGRWYPPQQAWPPVPAPPHAPNRAWVKWVVGIGALMLVFAIISLVVLARAIDTAVSNHNRRQAHIQNDGTIAACDIDELGDLRATVTVTNSSSRRSDYTVDVEFRSGGSTRLWDGTTIISNVDPGREARGVAVTATRTPPESVSCTIRNVSRSESFSPCVDAREGC
jgi:hypothetical protein